MNGYNFTLTLLSLHMIRVNECNARNIEEIFGKCAHFTAGFIFAMRALYSFLPCFERIFLKSSNF
jgi:hypothetical protein